MKKYYFKFFKILVAIAFCAYVMFIIFSQEPLIVEKNERLKALEIELLQAQSNEISIKYDIEMANTDDYIEQMAKEKLGLVKVEERIFIDIKK